jgi:hypothetical protein
VFSLGSGFNFFTNTIDKTPSTKDSWVSVDCSADVPSGSTGVVLEVRNTGTGFPNAGFRKNGSTDDYTLKLMPNTSTDPSAIGVFVGVDSNRIFQAKVSSNVEVWLIGYSDSSVIFVNNIVDVTPATAGSWQNIDLSAQIPTDATGVIMMIRWLAPTSSVYLAGGVRRNGSTNTVALSTENVNQYSIQYPYLMQFAKPDANRVIQGYTGDASLLKIYYCGYTKSPVTIKDDPVDVSISTASAWTDKDVTSQTSATADGALIYIKNSAWSVYNANIRKNGSTDNRTTYVSTGDYGADSASIGRGIGLDSSHIFEGWVDNTAVKFYLIGYCQPAAGGQTYTVDISESLGSPSDSVSYGMRRAVSISEPTIAVSDGVTRAFWAYRAVSEPSMTVSDAVSPGLFRSVSISEVSISFSDSTSRTLYRPQAISESLGNVSDSITRIFWTYRTISEASLSVSDSVVSEKITGLSRDVSEPAIPVSDSPYVTVKHVITITEPSISVSDFVSAGIFGKVKATKLFLVIGDLAIQLSG